MVTMTGMLSKDPLTPHKSGWTQQDPVCVYTANTIGSVIVKPMKNDVVTRVCAGILTTAMMIID